MQIDDVEMEEKEMTLPASLLIFGLLLLGLNLSQFYRNAALRRFTMVKLKQALGRREEQLRGNLFTSSTRLQSIPTARVAPKADDRTEARRQERALTPEISFAASDRRESDEGPAGIKERAGTSTPPHPVSGSYLVANETLDGRTLMESYMKKLALQ